MRDVAILLKELMTSHERVSFPNVGTFVKSSEGKITFDPTEIWNDGKLEHRYASTYHIPLLTAQKELFALGQVVKEDIRETNRHILPHFGILFLNNSEQLEFLEQENELEQHRNNPLPIHRLKHNRRHFGLLHPQRKFAFLVALVVIMGTGSTTLFMRSRNITPLSISNWFKNRAAQKENGEKNKKSRPAKESAKTEKHIATAKEEVIPVLPITKVETITKNQYFLVVGSEVSQKDAEEVVDFFTKKVGLSVKILERNSKFRIYTGCYKSMKEAEAQRQAIVKIVPDAWILEI